MGVSGVKKERNELRGKLVVGCKNRKIMHEAHKQSTFIGWALPDGCVSDADDINTADTSRFLNKSTISVVPSIEPRMTFSLVCDFNIYYSKCQVTSYVEEIENFCIFFLFLRILYWKVKCEIVPVHVKWEQFCWLLTSAINGVASTFTSLLLSLWG